MRWLLGIAAVLVLSLGSAVAHEERSVHYLYYYNEHGSLVFIPVFHEWDHPQAFHGFGFILVPIDPHVHEVHVIHRIHIHEHRWNGDLHHFKVRRYHRPVRHYYRGH
jgi:hypothetical protein